MGHSERPRGSRTGRFPGDRGLGTAELLGTVQGHQGTAGIRDLGVPGGIRDPQELGVGGIRDPWVSPAGGDSDTRSHTHGATPEPPHPRACTRTHARGSPPHTSRGSRGSRGGGGHTSSPPVPQYLGQGADDGALHDAAEEDEVKVGHPRAPREPHQVVQDLLHGWGGRGGGDTHGDTGGGTRRGGRSSNVCESAAGGARAPPIPVTVTPVPPIMGTSVGVLWGARKCPLLVQAEGQGDGHLPKIVTQE